MSIAHRISKMFNDDGQQFETENGQYLEDICLQNGAIREFAGRDYSQTRDLYDRPYDYIIVSESNHICGDPIRYKWVDGSAIVVSGDAWDIEGKDPFSWESV